MSFQADWSFSMYSLPLCFGLPGAACSTYIGGTRPSALVAVVVAAVVSAVAAESASAGSEVA
eukprot:10257494-Heterocapsa_arctica.AAC.1